MGELIKPEINTAVLTKAEEHRNLRMHLLMLLEAMQYKGSIKYLGNKKLRELVEEQKLIFVRKYEKELQDQHG